MTQDNKKNIVVETYAEDMAKVIEGDTSGLIKKIIHEEQQHEIEKKNLSPQSKKNKFFLLFSLLIIFIGVAILSYFIFAKESPSVPIEKQFVPIIFTDTSSLIEVSGLKKDEIEVKVANAVDGTSVKLEGVEGMYLTLDKSPVGLRKFIEIIDSSFIPGSSDFVDDNFLVGAVNNETKDFFILLKVRSIADIFDTMHTWEKKMFFDLHGFFGVDISLETKDLLTADFEDGIVQNKNARILYTKDSMQEKQIVMMYILVDDNSVVITNTENAAREIMLRLASSKVKK